jgi:hypothetical protein
MSYYDPGSMCNSVKNGIGSDYFFGRVKERERINKEGAKPPS